MQDKVECLECGKLFGVITSHHLHNCCGLTIEEYKEKYPGVKTISEKVKIKRSQNCKNMVGKTKTVKCSQCGEDMPTPIVNHWKYICEKCKEPETYEGLIYLEDQDKVVCQICWKAFDYLSWMHVKLHDMTLKEYREHFPDAIITNKRILKDRSERALGSKNPTKRKEVRRKLSRSQKWSAADYRREYKWIFPTIEEIQDENEEIQVKCKKCKTWFVPTPTQIQERIRALKYGSDGQYMYCSDECKGSCPLYRMNPSVIINSLNEEDESIGGYTNTEYYTFREEVLKRQRENSGSNFCEMCEKKEKLNVHHEKPKKTHPHMSLDPDNGIILCEDCHEKYGHSGDCSRAKLAQTICTPTKK